MDSDNSPALAALARDFAYGRKFLVWIGSGTSLPAGLPSWKKLREKLENRLTAIAPRVLKSMSTEEQKQFVAQIRRLPDPWDAFRVLKATLPKYDYEYTISIALDAEGVSVVPEPLRRVWSSSNVDGVISLNLDNLADRAFHEVYRGSRSLIKATSANLKLANRLLSDYQRFLVQVHGDVKDESSWVLTSEDLNGLLSNESYTQFLRACLSSRRILFIGCTPHDVAVKAHFEALAKVSPAMPHHYWLVPGHELTREVQAEVESIGIAPIEYSVDLSRSMFDQSKEHSGAILELFNYVETYQYSEPEPDPVNPMAPPVGERLPPERVQALHPEQARNLLSRYASTILDGPDTEKYATYQCFLDDYGPAIAVASYVSRDPGSLFFGHQYIEEVGSGAFSRVFRASAPGGGNEKAIKLVRNEVRDDPAMLRSFRRGVSSMKILHENKVGGMVSYDQAHEIPPCVIMPFVPGQNLEKLVSDKRFDVLLQGIPILRRVSDVVRAAHDLPQRVLHRDIRPSNIMIMPEEEGVPIDDRVVVLDFDLSWHEGADSDSPISPNMTTVLGYLAPEQVAQDLAVTARNTKVDSYGLCMTVFFLVDGRHPDYQQRRGADWERQLGHIGARLRDKLAWGSWLPRLRRLIDLGTYPDQSKRLDFNVVAAELRLLESLTRTSIAGSLPDALTLEALAEEIFCQTIGEQSYTWDSLAGTGNYVAVRQMNIEVRETAFNGVRGVLLKAQRPADITQQFSTVKKYWPAKADKIISLLSKAGWELISKNKDFYRELSFEFFAPEDLVWSSAASLAEASKQAWSQLKLD